MRASFNFNQKLALLVSLAGLMIIGVFLLPPIPQDASYHQFADKNSYCGMSNFWNVLSNLPFLLIGLLGMWDIVRGRLAILSEFRVGYLTFFIGVALVGPGSAYYHSTPDNASLLWDRLPMTIAFMALFVIVIAEYRAVAPSRPTSSAARGLLIKSVQLALLAGPRLAHHPKRPTAPHGFGNPR